MNKTTFWLLLSLFFCGFFFSTTSIAIQQIPIITFKELGRDKLLPVVGYPNGKPTLLFYSPAPFVGNNINISFPKIYRTDNLSAAVTVEGDQFTDMSVAGNLKDTFLIDALPLPTSSVQYSSIQRVLTLRKIIWFDKAKSYYALGLIQLYAFAQDRHCVTQKIVILESHDGINWTISNDNSQKIDVPTADDALDKMDIVGSGLEDNPTLIILNDEKIYCKHLKQLDAAWKIATPPGVAFQPGSKHDQIIRAYKNEFLLLRRIAKSQNKSASPLLTLTQNYFISTDGENWKQLAGDSSAVIMDAVTDNTGILIATVIDLTKNLNLDGSYTLTKELLETRPASSHLVIGEVVVDKDNNKISVNKKIFLKSALDNNTYAAGLSGIIYVPNSHQEVPGKYYISFYSNHSIGINAIAVAESLQGLSEVNLLPIHYDQRFFDSPPEDGLVNFNNQPYFLASIETSRTSLSVDTIFYRIID